MARFEYPSQRLQDWLSQLWVMANGRQVDPAEVGWLMGPFGQVDAIGDRFVARLAREEGLVVERSAAGAGLLDTIGRLNLGPADADRLRPEIAAFYEHTADFDLEVWSEWNPLFRPFGALIHRLYSRRLEQLNLPLRPLDTARGIASEVLRLRPEGGGPPRYTVWYRILKATGRVIYSGIYATCTLPSGPTCVKVAFPLPRGNATVLMGVSVGADGQLELASEGDGFGSPGFYFLLVDSRGRHWAQYIRSFRERITVFVDEEGTLRADHRLTLWRRRVLQLHYKMVPRPSAVDPQRGGPTISGMRDRDQDHESGPTAVLMIAHGSRQATANDDLHRLVERLAAAGDYPIVEASFLELAEPDIADGGDRCVARGAARVLMVPYFLSAGVHINRDLVAARDDLAARHPAVEFRLGPPLGPHPLLDELVRERIAAAAAGAARVAVDADRGSG